MTRVHLSPPDVRGDEAEMLLAALRSGWVAPAGPAIDAFEDAIAIRCGVPHVVALSSGTAALHLALLLAGVGPGDDVLVPTLSFVAAANAVRYCGARPCFLDVDAKSWNLSPDLLANELEARAQRNDLPAGVIPVDLYGQCADYDAIRLLCGDLGIPVVEDAAEALGATWGDQPAGSFGDFGVLSFNGNKIITTSGGGALLCQNADVANRARFLATQAREPAPHYEHAEVGYNYRLSNLLAALGLSQLGTLDDRLERRRAIRARYEATLGNLPGVQVALEDGRGRSNAWLTCITIDPDVAGRTPEDVRVKLEAYDIETRLLWKPMHAQPLYERSPARLDGTADRLFATGLCLPSGSGMTDTDLDRVIEAATFALTGPATVRAGTLEAAAG